MSANGIPTFDIGDELYLQGTFTNAGGTLGNPGSVVARVIDPRGTVTPLAPVEISTGVWQGTFAPEVWGEHWFRFEGTGAITAAAEERFQIRRQRVPDS